jgi:hypothetical protein
MAAHNGHAPVAAPAFSGSLLKRSFGNSAGDHGADWVPGQITWPADGAFLDLSGLPVVGGDLARCTALAHCDDDGRPCHIFRAGQRAHWYYEFEMLEDLYEPSGVITIANDKNIRVHGKNTIHLGVRPKHALLKGMRVRIHQSITLDITPGEYTYGIGLSAANSANPSSSLLERGFLVADIVQAGSFHVIPPVGPHLGLCDLPGECEVELCSSISPLTPDLAIHG